VSEYHTLVVPRQHFENIYDTPTEQLGNLIAAAKRVSELYRERLGITSVQLRNSSGADAGQDVFHVHLHVVPRRPGDDYMQWIPHPEWRSKFPALLERLR
jgi:histidine triad (HIT) family protein